MSQIKTHKTDWHSVIEGEFECWPVTCRVDEQHQTVFVAFNSSIKLLGETTLNGYKIVQEALPSPTPEHPFNNARSASLPLPQHFSPRKLAAG